MMETEMNTLEQPATIIDNVVVALDYTLTVEGSVVDTSEGDGPIRFIQGQGQIIPGLEQALYGMTMGESKDVVIPPKDGYGEEDPGAYTDIPSDEFPSEIPLELGVELELKNTSGDILEASIASVSEESVRLNFNHPLAGKILNFSVKVVELRYPTQDELDHGHVHDDESHE
jgi:FKBP-type peptidyl-prolyl cis-trans isomerase SlyD